MNIAQVLALPRAAAFAAGLLVPVALPRRKAHGIPFPIRLTALAWTTFIAPPGRKRRDSTPFQIDRRLDRLLEATSHGLKHLSNVGYSGSVMSLSLPALFDGYATSGEYPAVMVLTHRDEDGVDTLTVMVPIEWQLLDALQRATPPAR